MKLALARLAACASLAIGCSSASSGPVPSAPAAIEEPAPVTEDADPRLDGRPYELHVPKAHDATRPAPLLLAFHGYGDDDDGKLLETFFRFAAIADAHDFLYVAPDGTKDKAGQRFWNGTEACCDFDRKNPDDVGYVRALVADVAKTHAVDPKRIYAFGLSGGGFFVHRLACEASDLFAGVVSMSAATFADPERCSPKGLSETGGISVVEIHGDKDNVVRIEGGELRLGTFAAKYPSARETVARWAKLGACSDAPVAPASRLDLAASVAGNETKIERYEGCARGAVELWTMEGGPHAPALSKGFSETVWTFFESHPK